MSEILLLSVYTRFLEKLGYSIKRNVELESGSVDILAKKEGRTLMAEAKWVRSPGDIFETLGRAVKNKLAMADATPVLVIPIGVATEEIRESILGPSYKYGIEVHYVDVNKREVFSDYISTQLYPAIHSFIKTGRELLGTTFSPEQIKAVYTLVSSFKDISGPPELIADITDFLESCQKASRS